jgi:hypothetical protein
VTPTLSVDALQPTVIDVVVALMTARFVGVVGACASAGGGGAAHAFVVELIVALDDRLPAASNASTERLYVAPQSRPETVYDVEVVVPAVALSSYAV